MRHDSNGRQVGKIDRPAVVVPAPGVPKPSHLESQNGVYQRNEFPGARRFSHLGGSGANRPASSGCSGSRVCQNLHT